MEQKERLKKLIKKHIGNNKLLAEKMGITQQYLSKVTNGKVGIGNEFLSKLVRAYPNINLNWLLFGKGDVFISGDLDISNEPRLVYDEDKNPLKSYIFNCIDEYLECSDKEVLADKLNAIFNK